LAAIVLLQKLFDYIGGTTMKFLRGMFLLLTITAVGLGAQPSVAQQEVDPDHFDQPVASRQAPKQVAKSTAHKQTRGKNTVANQRTKQQPPKPTA